MELLKKQPYVHRIITSHISNFVDLNKETQNDIDVYKRNNNVLTNQFSMWLNETKEIIYQNIKLNKNKFQFKQFHPKNIQNSLNNNKPSYSKSNPKLKQLFPHIIQTLCKEDFSSFIANTMKHKQNKKKSCSLELQNNSFSYEPLIKTKVNINSKSKKKKNPTVNTICQNNNISIDPIVEQPSLEDKNKSSLSLRMIESKNNSINGNGNNVQSVNSLETPSFNLVMKDIKGFSKDIVSTCSIMDTLPTKSNMQHKDNEKTPIYTFAKEENETKNVYKDKISDFEVYDAATKNEKEPISKPFDKSKEMLEGILKIEFPKCSYMNIANASNDYGKSKLDENRTKEMNPTSSGENEDKVKYYNDEYYNENEYSITDNSESNEERESNYSKNKKVPSWANDMEYVKDRIRLQTQNNEYMKVFGSFRVENLNLAMIFYENQEQYAKRNSTADWEGDTSFVANGSNFFSDKYDFNKQPYDKSANRYLDFENA